LELWAPWLAARYPPEVELKPEFPTKISNSMTFAKLVVGAISALAIYVFITSGLLNIKLEEDINPAYSAASFAAGFTERSVNRAVGQGDPKRFKEIKKNR
jgi:hypothetical protein